MNAHPTRPAKTSDLPEVRRRLADAIEATDSAQMSPERARAILEERARLLARPAAPPPAAGEVLQVVVFNLGDERYAVETTHVREVVRLRDYAPLPGAPPFVFGALNLRGEILAVMDLRPFFGVIQREPTDHSRVLVLGGERAEFGLLVDSAREVALVSRADIFETPPTVSGVGREYLLGVTGSALIVLDGAVLLRDSRLFYQGEDVQGMQP